MTIMSLKNAVDWWYHARAFSEEDVWFGVFDNKKLLAFGSSLLALENALQLLVYGSWPRAKWLGGHWVELS